jgi:hypothetical protein
MRKTFLALFFFVTAIIECSNNKEQSKSQIVEASCGQCQFGMEGHGCELAVRIDGKPYFVDGTSLDSRDAHANDGFCTAIRKASVIGNKKQSFSSFTIQITRRKENRKLLR